MTAKPGAGASDDRDLVFQIYLPGRLAEAYQLQSLIAKWKG
jgi:hypothetical protein